MNFLAHLRIKFINKKKKKKKKERDDYDGCGVDSGVIANSLCTVVETKM